MQYEVEVKSLLGSQQKADELLVKLKSSDPGFHQTSQQKQLNHYFIDGDLHNLAQEFADLLTPEEQKQILDIAQRATSFNVRSRQRNNEVLLIVKGSLDDHSAAHSLRRMEFEQVVVLDIDTLDQRILDAGFKLEAKWSAERTIYDYKGMTVDMIFSPGYGYMVEFEKVVTSNDVVEQARDEILGMLKELGLSEFDNSLLERMFAYYNAHWQEYYGTRKVFTLQ